MLACREATKLMGMQIEGSLSIADKFSLGLHLKICKGCRNYQKQIRLIHQACQLMPELLLK